MLEQACWWRARTAYKLKKIQIGSWRVSLRPRHREPKVQNIVSAGIRTCMWNPICRGWLLWCSSGLSSHVRSLLFGARLLVLSLLHVSSFLFSWLHARSMQQASNRKVVQLLLSTCFLSLASLRWSLRL
jgi:hypothetical protein